MLRTEQLTETRFIFDISDMERPPAPRAVSRMFLAPRAHTCAGLDQPPETQAIAHPGGGSPTKAHTCAGLDPSLLVQAT